MSNSPGWKTDLEDGLVMRGATVDDADRLAEYNTEMHTDSDEPPEWMREWTLDLVAKPHPSMSLDDVIIIEDTNAGQIVSSCIYFQQTWSYCGIPVPFGRPELVSTHPDYRNRGLIRKQFDLMHHWGDERGHLVQGITGIPYYYRQFGYEMALEMGNSRRVSLAQLPEWKDGEQQSLRLRKAERADVALMVKLRAGANARSLFSPDVTPAELEYQFFERNPDSATRKTPWMIEDETGNTIGFAVFDPMFEWKAVVVAALEFAELSMFRTYTQPFLKSLRQIAEQLQESEGKPIEWVGLELAPNHPSDPFAGRSFRFGDRSYAWYVRTPDLPKLLLLIAPKLEERLIGTVFEGLTGEKVLNFYRSGLLLSFENGRIAAMETLKFPERNNALASLPDLTFLQLLFGRKTMSEITAVMVDARTVSDEGELLLDTLFPRMPSDTKFAIS